MKRLGASATAGRTLFIAAAVVALVGLSGCGRASGQLSVTLSPADATVDVPFELRISGLRPSQPVTISVVGRSANGKRSHAERAVRADKRGRVLRTDQYFLAQLFPSGGVNGRYRASLRVTVRGHEGASATAQRQPLAFDGAHMQMTVESAKRAGFSAIWTRPRSIRHHTAIMLLGGSEGGLEYGELDMALVAHGYPVLHLGYFGLPGLPPALERVPLEYFQRALRWMADQPEVDPGRIIPFGVSRGGELALILASSFPRLVHGAVGYVPSSNAVSSPLHPTIPAWTYRGSPVAGAIPIEASSGPIFVAGGDDDRIWPSGRSVRQIALRLHRHGRHDIVALHYHAAGHLLGAALPTQVTSPGANRYESFLSPYGPLTFGGTPRADENARRDAWPRLLRFLSHVADNR